jgi:hypothetical protein
MTAINVMRFRNAVHVATDGLIYLTTREGDSVCQHLAPKTFTASHLPMVLATRGAHGAAFTLGTLFVMQFQSFDALVDGIEQAFPALHEVYCHGTGYPDLPDVRNTELVLAGWSAIRAQAEAYFIRAGAEQYLDGSFPPFKLIELDAVLCAPWPSSLFSASGLNENDESVCRNMTAVMEAQRDEFPGRIGGFLQLITLTEQTITSRILRQWAANPHQITPDMICASVSEDLEVVEAVLRWDRATPSTVARSPARPVGCSRPSRHSGGEPRSALFRAG